jgi:DtxR family Mn-dependent transcriptional regulator
MPEQPSGLSPSAEDYLKAIYHLCEAGDSATTNAIAAALEVQPASVTGMVKRLAEVGLLEHVPYRGVQLTGTGTRAALRVLRRHRILEAYLTQSLGYGWEDVHQEAERLEHAASDQLIERMAEALGNPDHDPHGAPIPSPTGEVETTDSFTLADMMPGERARVRAIRDDDVEALLGAEEAGLLPGTEVRLTRRGGTPPFLRVEVGGPGKPELTLSQAVARRVFVVPRAPGAGESLESG